MKNKTTNATYEKNSLSHNPVQSLTRGLKILQKIAGYPLGISLKVLSDELKLPASTVHRLLLTLKQEGFVLQRDELATWHIGARAFAVGSAFFRSHELLTIVKPIMQQLMEKAGETINLLVLNDKEWKAMLIGQVECQELMRMVAAIGSELPLHASAAGKLFLAYHSSDKVYEIVRLTGLTQITKHTITDLTLLQQQLESIRQCGYAEDHEEHATGLYCVAAPIFNELRQVIAVLSISGPKVRIHDNRMLELAEMVKRSAAVATDSLLGNFSAIRSF